MREAVAAQAYLVEELFFSCTNERLFKISRQDNPPFYTASVRKSGPTLCHASREGLLPIRFCLEFRHPALLHWHCGLTV